MSDADKLLDAVKEVAKDAYISITDFGKSFCEICLCTTETITLGFTPNP